jgi:hypothetical protein
MGSTRHGTVYGPAPAAAARSAHRTPVALRTRAVAALSPPAHALRAKAAVRRFVLLGQLAAYVRRAVFTPLAAALRRLLRAPGALPAPGAPRGAAAAHAARGVALNLHEQLAAAAAAAAPAAPAALASHGASDASAAPRAATSCIILDDDEEAEEDDGAESVDAVALARCAEARTAALTQRFEAERAQLRDALAAAQRDAAACAAALSSAEDGAAALSAALADARRQAQQARAETEALTTCVVCMEAPRQVVTLGRAGCAHFACCAGCMRKLTADAARRRGPVECPVCRDEVEEVIGMDHPVHMA